MILFFNHKWSVSQYDLLKSSCLYVTIISISTTVLIAVHVYAKRKQISFQILLTVFLVRKETIPFRLLSLTREGRNKKVDNANATHINLATQTFAVTHFPHTAWYMFLTLPPSFYSHIQCRSPYYRLLSHGWLFIFSRMQLYEHMLWYMYV